MKIHYQPESAYWPVTPCGRVLWSGESSRSWKRVTCRRSRPAGQGGGEVKGFYRTVRRRRGYDIEYVGDIVKAECRPCGLKWQGSNEESNVKECPLCHEPTRISYLRAAPPDAGKAGEKA